MRKPTSTGRFTVPEKKAFLGCFFDRYMRPENFPAELHPLKFVENLEATTPRYVSRGLSMALDNILEMSTVWTKEQVEQANTYLAGEGVPTLSMMRLRYSKRLKAILTRGQINTEVEYYLVKGTISGGANDPDRAQQLQSLADAYESK